MVVVQSISRVLHSVTPRTAAYRPSRSFPISPSLVKLVSKASGAIQPSHPAATFSSCSFPFYCFLLFLCTVHFRRLSYLSLLFSGTLHSVGYVFGLVVFPIFFNLSLNFSIRSLSEPQSAPGLVFADCIKLLHLLLQRI